MTDDIYTDQNEDEITVDTEKPPAWYSSDNFLSAVVDFGDFAEGVAVHLQDPPFQEDLTAQRIKDPSQGGVYNIASGIVQVEGDEISVAKIFGGPFPAGDKTQEKANWLKGAKRKAVNRILAASALFARDVRTAGNESDPQ